MIHHRVDSKDSAGSASDHVATFARYGKIIGCPSRIPMRFVEPFRSQSWPVMGQAVRWKHGVVSVLEPEPEILSGVHLISRRRFEQDDRPETGNDCLGAQEDAEFGSLHIDLDNVDVISRHQRIESADRHSYLFRATSVRTKRAVARLRPVHKERRFTFSVSHRTGVNSSPREPAPEIRRLVADCFNGDYFAGSV